MAFRKLCKLQVRLTEIKDAPNSCRSFHLFKTTRRRFAIRLNVKSKPAARGRKISAKLASSERVAVYFCAIFPSPRGRSLETAILISIRFTNRRAPLASLRCCPTPLEHQPEYVISPWSFRTLNLPSPLRHCREGEFSQSFHCRSTSTRKKCNRNGYFLPERASTLLEKHMKRRNT